MATAAAKEATKNGAKQQQKAKGESSNGRNTSETAATVITTKRNET